MPDDNKQWKKKYFYIGLTAFCVIAASIVVYYLLSNGSGLGALLKSVLRALSPIIWGCVIAYILNPPMKLLEGLAFSRLAAKLSPKGSEAKRHRIARAFSAGISLLLLVGLVSGFVALVIPQVIDGVKSVVSNMNTYVEDASALFSRFMDDNPELLSYAESIVGNLGDTLRKFANDNILGQADKILANITGGIYNVFRGILDAIIGLVVSFYLLYHKETFAAQSKKIIYSLFKPRRANAIVRGFSFVDKKCGGFLAGKVLDSLIIGLICYICLLILNMPYAALISLIVCVTNVIPIFGPFIGAIPGALLLLFVNPVKCLIFIIYIIILQQVDGNIIGPKILGRSIGLSGFWIMFSLLFFGGIFGFWGMVIGVPVFSVIYSGIQDLVRRKLAKRSLPQDTEEYKTLDHIDEQTNEPVHGQYVPPRENIKKMALFTMFSRKKKRDRSEDEEDK